MNITRENYESFFLDYLEGFLDPSMMEEMNTFLNINRDLKEELEEFEQVYLQADPITYTDKDRLQRSSSTFTVIHDQDFDHLCIAKLEGDLNPVQEKALEQFLIDQPRGKKELETFYKTKLQPSPVVFPGKQLLKRKPPAIWRKYPWYSISAAASVIIILLFSMLLGTFRTPQEELIAIIPLETESIDAGISEEVKMNEQLISSAAEEISEAMDYKDKNEEIETMVAEVVAMITPAMTEQENENISENHSGIVEDGTTNMEFLKMREFGQISATPYGPLTTLKIVNQEIEIAEEYLTLREIIVRRFRNAVLMEEPGATRQTDKLTFLEIADAGVRGISRIPGFNMQLDRYYDQNGELASYAFTSRPLSFSHEVKKKISL